MKFEDLKEDCYYKLGKSSVVRVDKITKKQVSYTYTESEYTHLLGLQFSSYQKIRNIEYCKLRNSPLWKALNE